MTGFNQVLIGGYPSGGLTTDKKPLMLANEAFSNLQNAYVFRDRTKKRDGEVGIGRLRRFFSAVSIGNSGASPWTFNIYSTVTGQSYFPITPEPNAEIAEGTVSISIVGIPTPFLDQGNGILTNATPGNSGTINYLIGNVTLITTVGAGAAATISFGYYPSLQAMGIWRRDVATIGIDQTVFFDTKYAYQYVTGGFQELVAGQVWTGPNNANGTNTFFFWSANYQGATPSQRYFFTTNNNITLGAATPYDPIYYYNNSVWTALQPQLDAVPTFLYQALIIIPYYGRLLALNTWEGPKNGGNFDASMAVNYYARCRFSKIGDPIAADSWRIDQFGKGGFLDAPTNESIVSVGFFRNTLIVFFEYSTWQLRYVGEYGLPFIFERISSDFGAVSTFSPIVFDQGVMAVSDRGIIQASAGGLSRLDDQIPDEVFGFEIQNNAPDFVHGIRDFKKEVVYWNYYQATDSGEFQVFPNTTLLYNYKNSTWAKFRDTITCFGTAQFQFGITWDSLTTFWDSNVSWDNTDNQNYVDYVTSGNQQGYISIYENQDAATTVPAITMFAPSLAITAFNLGVSPNIITVPNHNFDNEEIIYLTGALWLDADPGFNNIIYQVIPLSQNTISLKRWDQTTLSYENVTLSSASTYIGGGQITLLRKMNIVGKDFNPYQANGKGFKISYIDFQMDSNSQYPGIPAVSVQLFVNSYLGEQANLLAGSNQELENSSQMVGFIQEATQANPCVIESKDHSLQPNQLIYISNVQGMIELNSGNYNITVIDSDHFSLNGINSTGFTPYTAGGIWNTNPVDGQTYIQGSQYAWYRFYSTQFGQYLRVAITYDDTLMNQLGTHQTPMELNAMNLWLREGGRMF